MHMGGGKLNHWTGQQNSITLQITQIHSTCISLLYLYNQVCCIFIYFIFTSAPTSFHRNFYGEESPSLYCFENKDLKSKLLEWLFTFLFFMFLAVMASVISTNQWKVKFLLAAVYFMPGWTTAVLISRCL